MERKKPNVRRLDGPVRRQSDRTKPKPSSRPQRDDFEVPSAAKSVNDPVVEVISDDGSTEAFDPNKDDSYMDARSGSNDVNLETSPTDKPRRSWASKLKPTRKRTLIALGAAVIVVIGFVGVKAVLAGQRVVTKNSTGGAPVLAGEVDPTKLKGEGDGRINILMLGIGGSGHDGGSLSDTIMVASIDPVNKTVAMLSIPRDMYVKIPGYGYSKINAANSYGGPELAKEVVGKILDLPIHYYVQADFAGFKQAVNAVGGVDIDNQTKLYDSEYPCDNDKGYCTYSLPVGKYHMDGTAALKFARCRHGLCGNDFGRAARQQQLMVALREKALQASTLTNPIKITGLIDSVGDHVRTDMQLNEIQKLAGMVKDLDVAKATTKVLDNSTDGLLVDGSGQFPGAGSILIPKAGAFDYSDIQELAHSIFIDGYLRQEAAAVAIQNGTLRSGLGAAVAKQLKAYNYNVISVSTAETQSHTTSTIIDYTNGKKPYTVKYLQSRFHAEVQKANPPATVAGQPTPDIVIIVGNDYKPSTQ
jgi:polyisoprenyl-teichoic acid--peptidoglycan teichoic acid transferase